MYGKAVPEVGKEERTDGGLEADGNDGKGENRSDENKNEDSDDADAVWLVFRRSGTGMLDHQDNLSVAIDAVQKCSDAYDGKIEGGGGNGGCSTKIGCKTERDDGEAEELNSDTYPRMVGTNVG